MNALTSPLIILFSLSLVCWFVRGDQCGLVGEDYGGFFFGFGAFVVVLMEVVVMSCGFEPLRQRWWWVVRMMVGLSL